MALGATYLLGVGDISNWRSPISVTKYFCEIENRFINIKAAHSQIYKRDNI
ncbi:hypothetical protein PI95_004935 [Hassallia byssoidea VB512170]|uniref:Uncharacterized protein n=1 Tax=Hassallia byssoidea VB512170 TaxID=1304833 RepID=A0A846H2R3_9CYAN|nr:hypothetical protein [Hassalia byssoidea]MBW4567813.1 hypothetical protein [Tolypothrix carrinoi HA7290-LM1]NEU71937.1 hypothetical protein [Hassalia byssoidea VB512170]